MAKRTSSTKPSSGSSRKSKIDVVPGTQFDEYAIPHAGWLILLAVGVVVRVRLLPTTLQRVAVAVAILIASCVLAYFVYEYARARHPFQRAHAAATPVLAGAGLAVTLVIGVPAAWAWIYVISGITLAATWNVRNARVVKGDGGDKHEEKRGWDEVHGIPGSKARVISEDGDKAHYRITAVNGQGRKQIAQAAESIANVKGAQAGSARVLPPPGNRGDQGDVIIMKRDVLSEKLRRPLWDGTRRSIVEGLALGLFEDKHPVIIKPAGGTDEESPVNLQVMGASRTGKSHCFRLSALGIAETDDCVLWVSDTVKGRQTIRPLLPAIDWYVSDRAGAFAMFAAIKRVIKYRADQLGELGLDEWRPGCGMPVLIAWIEEAADIVGNSENFVKLCATALSAGVIIVNSMQRASYDNIPTSARANILAALCFAVQSTTDAGFVLPDDVMDSAIPHQWFSDLKSHRGKFYAVGPGVDHLHQSMPAKTWSLDHDGTPLNPQRFAELIAARAPGMARTDAGTAAAAGQPYTDRTKPGMPDGPPINGGTEEMEELSEWDDEADEELDELTAMPPLDPDDAREVAGIDPRQPLVPAQGEWRIGPIGTPGPPLTRAARHAAWVRVVDQVAGQQKTEQDRSVVVELTTDDGRGLIDAWLREPGVTLSTRPWVHTRLNAWIADGLVERTDRGAYRLSASLLQKIGDGTLPVAESDTDEALVRSAAGGPPA